MSWFVADRNDRRNGRAETNNDQHMENEWVVRIRCAIDVHVNPARLILPAQLCC